MRNEKTKEKEYMKVIECPAVKGLLREEDCNEECQFFVRREEREVEKHEKDGNSRKTPFSAFTICRFPKKRPIFPVTLIEGE